MFTIADWLRWQNWMYEHCSGCEFFDRQLHECRSKECKEDYKDEQCEE